MNTKKVTLRLRVVKPDFMNWLRLKRGRPVRESVVSFSGVSSTENNLSVYQDALNHFSRKGYFIVGFDGPRSCSIK